jgi:hypothetical protein
MMVELLALVERGGGRKVEIGRACSRSLVGMGDCFPRFVSILVGWLSVRILAG